MKYLVVLAVLLLVWHVWRSKRVPPSPPAKRTLDAPEPMVHCAVCQLHVPRSNAVVRGTRLYCSPQHAAADTKHSAP